MRRLLVSATVFCLFVTLMAPCSHAVREVTITPIDPSKIQPLEPSGEAVGCQVGNLNPAAFAVGNFIDPPETYALIFDPLDSTCGNCGLGFQISTVSIQLQTSAATTIVMESYLSGVEFPTDPSCGEPASADCSSGLLSVEIPSAGGWIIGLPMDCECAFLDYPFALGVRIESVSGGVVPDLITDATPTSCTNYNDFGGGWYDLLTQFPTWPGNLKIWADAVCCEPPVGADEESLGGLKSKYKDE